MNIKQKTFFELFKIIFSCSF